MTAHTTPPSCAIATYIHTPHNTSVASKCRRILQTSRVPIFCQSCIKEARFKLPRSRPLLLWCALRSASRPNSTAASSVSPCSSDITDSTHACIGTYTSKNTQDSKAEEYGEKCTAGRTGRISSIWLLCFRSYLIGDSESPLSQQFVLMQGRLVAEIHEKMHQVLEEFDPVGTFTGVRGGLK